MTELGHVHFMGVGGAGMSGIARIMAMRSMTVSGCDVKDSRALTGLRALGVSVAIGHDPAHLERVNTLVYSSAIRLTAPELVAARESGIAVLQRAEALAALMQGYRVVAVAGTHGKTTTTSMIAVALQRAGLDPSFAIGGTLGDSGANAHHGAGEVFVAESDESDGSFTYYRPEIAVITNIEADHLDHYAGLDEIVAGFKEFAGGVSRVVVGCADDQHAGQIARAFGGITYGTAVDSDLRLTDITSSTGGVSFHAHWKGRPMGPVQLRLPGRHNALNAGAALAVGALLGVDFQALIQGLEAFTGTKRRFEIRGEHSGVVVVDDYAHHPTEIAATLSAAREMFPDRRLIAVFQPHRYSRTAAFLGEFADALTAADEVIVTEVYAAGEEAIPGASGAALAHEVAVRGGSVRFEPSLISIADHVVALAHQSACILTLGAGDITLIAPDIVAAVSAAR